MFTPKASENVIVLDTDLFNLLIQQAACKMQPSCFTVMSAFLQSMSRYVFRLTTLTSPSYRSGYQYCVSGHCSVCDLETFTTFSFILLGLFSPLKEQFQIIDFEELYFWLNFSFTIDNIIEKVHVVLMCAV